MAYAEASARKQRLPPFPEALKDVWNAFNRLASRRQSGNAPNPLLFSEIKALCEHLGFGDWEMALIERIDNVALAALSDRIANAGKPEESLVPFSDGEGVRAFMTRLTIQQNARVAAQRKGG